MRRLGLLLTVAVTLFPACSGRTPPAVLHRVTAPTTTAPAPAPPPEDETIALSAAGFDVQAASPPSPGTVDAAKAGVLATLNRYLDAGVLAPLRTGGPAGELAPLFTPGAAPRVASGPDRGAFIDESVPRLTGLRAESASVGLIGLAGADGTISVVDAVLDLRLIGTDGNAWLTVVRTGELVLLPEPGGWKIDGWDIRASRDSVAGVTTTAAQR